MFKEPSYFDEKTMRPTSRAFKLRKDEKGLSVNRESLTTFEKAIEDPAKFYLFALNVGQIRTIELDCISTPDLPENPAHADIVGIDDKKAKKLSSEEFSSLVQAPLNAIQVIPQKVKGAENSNL